MILACQILAALVLVLVGAMAWIEYDRQNWDEP